MTVRTWADARSLSDLGVMTARWLEGDEDEHPGHYGQPDDETATLIPVLAAMNRAGFVTIGSQPGMHVGGHIQRAAVDFLCDHAHLTIVQTFLARHDFTGIITEQAPAWWRQWALTPGEMVTGRLNGEYHPDNWSMEPLTYFGGQLRRRDISRTFHTAHHHARQASAAAWHVTIIDMEWGPNDRLWRALAADLCGGQAPTWNPSDVDALLAALQPREGETYTLDTKVSPDESQWLRDQLDGIAVAVSEGRTEDVNRLIQHMAAESRDGRSLIRLLAEGLIRHSRGENLDGPNP